jgi:GNAT superfamily N-acetyltransferase
MQAEARRGSYILSTDRGHLDRDLLHEFLSRSYWSAGIARPVLERAIEHSLCFGLYEGRSQVGFARVITDQATFAYLADVFILEAHRGQGLATWMVQCILAHAPLQGLRRFLLATRDAHEVYRRCGFGAVGSPDRLMEIFNPRVYETQGRAQEANGFFAAAGAPGEPHRLTVRRAAPPG